MMDTVHFFTDESDEWRWHRKSENGEVVSESGEGYINLEDCVTIAVEQFMSDVAYVNDEEVAEHAHVWVEKKKGVWLCAVCSDPGFGLKADELRYADNE